MDNNYHIPRNARAPRNISTLKQKLAQFRKTFSSFTRRHKIISAILLAVGLALLAILIAWVIAISTVRTYPSAGASEYAEQLPKLKAQVDKQPKSADAHKAYAVALYASGDTNAAIDEYKKAVSLNSKDAVAYNNLGNAYRDEKRYDDAVAAYKKAISLDKTTINTYANLANLQFYSLGDHAAAIATYKQGVQNNPDSTSLKLLLAIAYEQDGQKDQAMTTYEDVLKTDPSNQAAKAGLERLKQ